jgi:glucose 1-dehydrogenase
MRLVPYKRIGEPDDIGRAAVGLASDGSDYVIGTSPHVDGGMTLFRSSRTADSAG